MTARWHENPRGSGNWVLDLSPLSSIAVFQKVRATPSLAAHRAWTFDVDLFVDDDHIPHKTKGAAQRAALRHVRRLAQALIKACDEAERATKQR